MVETPVPPGRGLWVLRLISKHAGFNLNTFSESVTKDTSILGSDNVVNLEVTFMVPLAPKKNVLKQIDHESTKKNYCI